MTTQAPMSEDRIAELEARRMLEQAFGEVTYRDVQVAVAAIKSLSAPAVASDRKEPPLSCPHIDRFLSSADASPELKAELEAIRDINSQLRWSLWHVKQEAAEARNAALEEAAKVCDNREDMLADKLAAEIRALKSSAPAGERNDIQSSCGGVESDTQRGMSRTSEIQPEMARHVPPALSAKHIAGVAPGPQETRCSIAPDPITGQSDARSMTPEEDGLVMAALRSSSDHFGDANDMIERAAEEIAAWRKDGLLGFGNTPDGATNANRSLAARLASAGLLPVAQEGWQLVPKQPTEAMLAVLHDQVQIQCNPADKSASILNDAEVYSAMVKKPLTAWQQIKDNGKDFPPRVVVLRRQVK